MSTRALVLLYDEIIESLFKKKYQPMMKEISFDIGRLEDFSEDQIKREKYDLVICDMDQFSREFIDLYHACKDTSPFLFITDNQYDQYLGLLKNHQLSNIYPKGLMIEDYLTTSKLIGNLCKKNIFGINNYTEYPTFLETVLVHYSSEIRKLSFKINFLFPFLSKEKSLRLKLAFYEIASNAFFHSHNIRKGTEAYIKDPIFISFAEDSEKILFSITDKKGTLNRDTVFYWLFKRVTEEDSLSDDHGRGFFLMKNIVDNLIINIRNNKMTEFIAIFYKNDYMGEKSLIIQQIEEDSGKDLKILK